MRLWKSALLVAVLLSSGCTKNVIDTRSGHAVSNQAYNQAIARQGQAHYCGMKNCDTPPQLIHASAPVFPAAALQNHQAGFVSITFDIETTGLVSNIRVESATSDDFAKSAVQAVKGWRFKPAMLNGQPVKISGREQFPFSLNPVR